MNISIQQKPNHCGPSDAKWTVADGWLFVRFWFDPLEPEPEYWGNAMHEIWTNYGAAFIPGALFVGGFFVLTLWLASIALKDTSIVDVFWGPGCAAMAWIFFLTSPGAEPRAMITIAFATVWGVRLGIYIGMRNWGAEDARYARLRRHITDKGGNYMLHSLRAIFFFQGGAMLLCTLPLLVAIVTSARQPLGAAAYVAIAMLTVGVLVETIADWQMGRFRATRSVRGEVMDRGLWRYSRHPNYFAEMLVQWGFFLMALDTGPWAAVTIVAPLALSYLIMGPMGANLLERRLGKKSAGYEDYIRRTSAFFPWPPKSNAS
jgi:steroid 5-alpha reductase family enzyme